MTGKELIKWILDNDAVDKHIFIAKNTAGDSLRSPIKRFKNIFDAKIAYSTTDASAFLIQDSRHEIPDSLDITGKYLII